MTSLAKISCLCQDVTPLTHVFKCEFYYSNRQKFLFLSTKFGGSAVVNCSLNRIETCKNLTLAEAELLHRFID